jgi:Leucine-rich repeat (LRR) protein
LLVLAVLIATVPAVYILLVQVDLGPRDRNVDGKRHVTLTGWDRDDYAVLRLLPDVSVLQMANADVTDHVIAGLGGMKNLEELDLNGTQVTDAGLGIIRDLPALATLRLARTKITDKGFRDFLSSKESLMQLDLQHTQVSRDTVKTWRAGNPDRKAL